MFQRLDIIIRENIRMYIVIPLQQEQDIVVKRNIEFQINVKRMNGA